MNREELIKSIANIVMCELPGLENDKIYVSKIDGSYITHVGMEDKFDMFLRFGITEQIQGPNKKVAYIGYNPIENKWYGWSHRAIYGFTIGSECKKGHCHYQADTKENFIEDCNNFWNDEYHYKTNSKEHINEKGEIGVLTTWEYADDVPNEKVRGTINSVFTKYPENFGRGEWVAQTIEDAKQMAIDFAEGVA